MNATAYYITVVTQGVELVEYDEVASALVKAFYILTSEHLTEFTKPHLSEPRCEVEVMASANDGDSKYTIQAVAVLQANSPKPWTLLPGGSPGTVRPVKAVHDVPPAQVHRAEVLEEAAKSAVDVERESISESLPDGHIGAQDLIPSDSYEAENGN